MELFHSVLSEEKRGGKKDSASGSMLRSGDHRPVALGNATECHLLAVETICWGSCFVSERPTGS